MPTVKQCVRGATKWARGHKRLAVAIVIGIAAIAALLILTQQPSDSKLKITFVEQEGSGSGRCVEIEVKNCTDQDLLDVAFIVHTYDADGKKLLRSFGSNGDINGPWVGDVVNEEGVIHYTGLKSYRDSKILTYTIGARKKARCRFKFKAGFEQKHGTPVSGRVQVLQRGTDSVLDEKDYPRHFQQYGQALESMINSPGTVPLTSPSVIGGAITFLLLALVVFFRMRRRTGSACEPGEVGRVWFILGQFVVLLLVAAGIAAIIYSPYQDRKKVAKRIVRTRRFDTSSRRMTPSTLRVASNRSLQKIQEILESPEHPGRFYASPQDQDSPAATRELFAFSILPGIAQRTDIICGFFSAEVAGVNKTVLERFRPQMPKYRNFIELFNIRYLLCATPNTGKLAGVETYADIAQKDSYWTLYRARGDYSHFAALRTKPILVYADVPDWRRFCHRWIDTFKDTPDPERFPYFVMGGTTSGKHLNPDAERHSAVLFLDANPELDKQVIKELRHYAIDNGGKLLSVAPLPGLPTTRVRDVEGFRFQTFLRDPALKSSCQENIVEREHHGARIDMTEAGFVLFKMAYYASWFPEINGEKLDLIEMSPGFCGVYLPAGSHNLEFVYDGPNNYRLGWFVSAITLILAVSVLLVLWKKKRRWESFLPKVIPRSIQSPLEGRISGWAITIIMAAVGIFLVCGYVAEQFYGIPVPSRPSSGSTMPVNIMLDWNKIKQRPDATYDVQIDDTGRWFKHVVYERRDISTSWARKQQGLQPGRKYWWRMRSKTNGKTSPWCLPVSFRTKGDPLRFDDSVPYSIDVAHKITDEGGIAVRGESNLPDGSYINVRVYRPDTMVRLQSADVRLANGRFQTVLRKPEKGWNYKGQVLLCCDCSYFLQNYPAIGSLGEYGRSIRKRGVAASHKLLYGLLSTTIARADEPRSQPPPLPSPSADMRSRLYLMAKAWFTESGELRVAGISSLPNNSQLRIWLTPETHVDPVKKTYMFVHNGVFGTAIKVDASRNYRVDVQFSPDIQYQATRQKIGECGEMIERNNVPEDERVYGLRREFAFELQEEYQP